MFKHILIILFAVGGFSAFSQETLPIYSDYLSDNIFLIHPAAAGVGNCAKIRLTGRKQWQGVKNPPELQTLSFHNKVGERTALGFVAFNDKNGFHSQKGFQGAYAYHIELGGKRVFEQLSFALSATLVQNQTDQRAFFGDPQVSQLIQSSNYFNTDFGLAYHLGGLSSYLTVKNLLSTRSSLNTNLEPLDLRNFILSASYFFDYNNKIQFEPGFMLQLREGTGETIADFNIKAYKKFKKATLWAALSYRRSFEKAVIENMQYVTPVVGLNVKQFMLSYTYTKQLGSIVFSDASYHQITLGMNLFCRKPRAAACPNINFSL